MWSNLTGFTDNNLLVNLQTAKLGSVEQCWAAHLASYNFDLKHRPGGTNTMQLLSPRHRLDQKKEGKIVMIWRSLLSVSYPLPLSRCGAPG